MKAVLLMAGRGSRMAKTHEGPKQLFRVGGKPVLEHTLDNMPDAVDELIFVVGGQHEDSIRTHFSQGHHKGRPITFVHQESQQGTAHAFWTAAPHLSGLFLGLLADDIVGAASLRQLAESRECAVLAQRVSNPETFGVLVTDADGYLVRIVEKPQEFVSDLISTGAMLLDDDFLATRVLSSPRGEYETPTVVTHLIETKNKRFRVIETNEWIPVNNAQELERAHQSFAQNLAL